MCIGFTPRPRRSGIGRGEEDLPRIVAWSAWILVPASNSTPMEQIEDCAIPATAAPQPVVNPEPTVEALVELRDQLTPIQWEARLAKAQRALWVVHQVRELRRQHGRTLSWRACLRQVDPLVSWSRYLHWRRRLSSEEGQEWERLLDRRLPPRPAAIAPEVLNAATILRRANPSISVESAQAHLVAQFDQRGNVSASALRRTWRMAGLNQQPPGGPDHFEVVKHFNGGAGLALIEAANLETGAFLNLAKAALAGGGATVAEQKEGTPAPPTPGRNELGQFTGDFNRAMREGVAPGKTDRRWDTDSAKRAPQTTRRPHLPLGSIILFDAIKAVLATLPSVDGACATPRFVCLKGEAHERDPVPPASSSFGPLPGEGRQCP